tara:strand:- start:159 stop:1316 length:1158 start_codon:yes stop_codon:yes gene_type:complete
MARQNVGNPKFYIDLPSYFMATGGGVSSADDIRKIFGINPSEAYIEEHEIGADAWAYFDFLLHYYYRGVNDSNVKYFLGVLGHNFETEGITNVGVEYWNNNTHDYDSDDMVFNMEDNWNEICNFPTAGSTFGFNGWSLAEWTTTGWNYDHTMLRFKLRTPWASETKTVMLGSMLFGYAFQMPHSPDLKLTMTREYDGVKEQTTRGGSTLTQINYASPPLWLGQHAWGLTEGNAETYYNDNHDLLTQYPRRGRKTWDLKFSYIGSDNLFPLNERRDYNNPTDSNTNELGGYDIIENGASDDFFTGANTTGYNRYGNFQDNYDTDWSFMNVVMEKTIGGALPFIFQPDGNNNSPDQFAICKLDQSSFKFKQVAHNVWDISLKIREVW